MTIISTYIIITVIIFAFKSNLYRVPIDETLVIAERELRRFCSNSILIYWLITFFERPGPGTGFSWISNISDTLYKLLRLVFLNMRYGRSLM